MTPGRRSQGAPGGQPASARPRVKDESDSDQEITAIGNVPAPEPAGAQRESGPRQGARSSQRISPNGVRRSPRNEPENVSAVQRPSLPASRAQGSRSLHGLDAPRMTIWGTSPDVISKTPSPEGKEPTEEGTPSDATQVKLTRPSADGHSPSYLPPPPASRSPEGPAPRNGNATPEMLNQDDMPSISPETSVPEPFGEIPQAEVFRRPACPGSHREHRQCRPTKGGAESKLLQRGQKNRVEPTVLPNTVPANRLRVAVFGTGTKGQLGLGNQHHHHQSPTVAPLPRFNHLLIPPSCNVVQVAVGAQHCAAVTDGGRIVTWGNNEHAALGRVTGQHMMSSSVSHPWYIERLGPVETVATQVAVTNSATFVLTQWGQVYGWGTFCKRGQPFGFLREQAQRGVDRLQTTPIPVPGLRNIKQLSAGSEHMLALDHEGKVWTWGVGDEATLGRRLMPRERHGPATLVPRVLNLPKKGIVNIFAGFYHNFAIDAVGDVWAWGLNPDGRTGIPVDGDEKVAMPRVVEVLRGRRIKSLSAGFDHSLACTEDGAVLAWGRCKDGRLGFAADEDLPDVDVLQKQRFREGAQEEWKAWAVVTPTVVPGVRGESVEAGEKHSLAVGSDGWVYSWGRTDDFRTGLNTQMAVDMPGLLYGDAQQIHCTFAGSRGAFSIVAGTGEPDDAESSEPDDADNREPEARYTFILHRPPFSLV
ncbi:hypothetical protein HIM_00350 [Hirsutella minnesotensis 3608]|nr:hypothetical protein HIM_00350 [Hirsutella minnesotensis 3608]